MAQNEQTFLHEWLWENFEPMPIAAENFLAWRTVVRLAFEAYRRSAKEKRKRPEQPSEFIDTFLECFPEAKLSEWRWVDGNWEKELDGVLPKGSLFKSVKVKPRIYMSEKMAAKFSPKED